MIRHWRMLIAVLALALWPATASATLLPATTSDGERILDYSSKIAIQKDGSLDVVEAIRVNVENVQIRHGIYRDFPTRYSVPHGGRMKVDFDLLDASLDGAPVRSSRESLSNGEQIRLGDPDHFVATGEHLYTLHYRVTRELGFFKDYDELYWNVTGNGWIFPIDHVSATITLPSPAAFSRPSAYTGHEGDNSGVGDVTSQSPGSISFATTAPLAAYEGLTVAAAFPKGVVDAPTQSQRAGWWLADLLPMVIAAAGLAGVIGFLFVAYAKAGRDPRPGTIVPLFAPPEDMTPGEMRYLMKEQMDNRAFAATIVDAGVKGHVRLVEEKGFMFFGGDKYIEGTETPSAVPLAAAEQDAISTLVQPGGRIDLDNENHETFSSARRKLERAYKEKYEGKAFRRNYGWAGAAILIWAAAAYLTSLSIVSTESLTNRGFILLPLLALAGGALLLYGSSRLSSGLGCLVKIIGVIILFVGGSTAVGVIPLALASGRWPPIVLIGLGLPLAISSFAWISAPTKEGRILLDRIAGFKQYLATTERERFDRMQAPDETLHLFEQYLPYAIALGVENRWADRFSAQLAAAASAGNTAGHGFAWYSGSHSPWSDSGGFVNSIGSSLSSSISSASTAPGSSSGSGGGGFSGGGGGGGGGGGW